MKRLVFDSWLVDPYRVLLMDGIEGKRSFLASLMGWQSNRTWWTVSYGCIQRLHSGRCRGLNLLMWLFSLLWPVLNWKMLHWSGLGRLFIGSSFTGFDMWLYITRPVVPADHLFSHCSLKLLFRIWFVVGMLHFFSGCSFCVPSLARRSAVSLPCIPQCPGIHWRVISTS